ncbi:MAG: AAA family ATPase [Nannocystis sp.]|nr:AAA family ATPase [Nannocystis sp.]
MKRQRRGPTSSFREPIYVHRFVRRIEPWRVRHLERLGTTLIQLVRWQEAQPELFESVVEIGRRLGVFDALSVRSEELPQPADGAAMLPTHEAELLVDGLNAGYLSDGTLRILEVVTNLVNPRTTVLLVEEPETAIHPGLLTRLLAELDAFAHQQQLVISMHAPALLNWARPDEVRLVSRSGGVTVARPLTPDELERVGLYLDDDLGISDFVFSGVRR